MTTALVAGATGMLGSRIGHFLLELDDVDVRLLARPGWEKDTSKRTRLDPLSDRGAVVVTADLDDRAALGEALEGVGVVVSALQGRRDVIVDGQIALADAAVRTGVRRFLPSDFAVDLFNAPHGAPQFEARKDAGRVIDAMELEVVHVLTGAFMDAMFGPGSAGPVDMTTGTIAFWGTGDEPFDLSTIDDTARFTARLAVDPEVDAGVHTISAGPTTYKQIARTIERASGIRLSATNLGDEEQLRQVIEAKSDPWDAVYEWYALAMLKTPTFPASENDRYRDARPTSVDEYLAAAYGSASA